tara:strand:+ start:203 stop:1537 length:1335 start_codon:yes stop_codon:yes gene_type:complete
MASTFTKADNVTIPGNFGKPISVPYYLQFVPGIVTEVVTSDASFQSFNKAQYTNTILAMPHITDKPKRKKSDLTNSDRYFPLMRGFVDVPAKGDPVLLCDIGGVKYYLGPLNTQNNPNFNNDFMFVPEKPITDIVKMTTDEKRTMMGQSLNFKKVNHNRMMKPIKDELDKGEAINETHGDMMFEGRHGNSLRIGSRDKNPYVFISNGRHSNNFNESNADGSLISITNSGTINQHFGQYVELEKPNPDDDTTWTRTPIPFILGSDRVEGNQRLMSRVVKSINQVDDVNQVLYNYDKNQVFINSDRIIFNSRGNEQYNGDIYLSAKNDIHIGAGNSLSISTNKNLIIEANKTYLGDVNKPNYSRTTTNSEGKEETKSLMEPMVLGNQLFDIFDELFSILEKTTSNQYFPLTLAYQGAPLKDVLDPLRQKIDAIKSKHHFIEPNDRG